MAATLVVAASLAAGTACSGDDQSASRDRDAADEDSSADRQEARQQADDSRDPEDSREAESTTDLMEREQEAVEEGYVAAMRARIDSGSPPDPDFPNLAETHVDPMLEEWTGQLERWAFTDHVVRYPEFPDVTVLSVTFGWDTGDGSADTEADDADGNSVGNLATVQACIVDGGQLVHQPTGDVERQENADSSGLVTVYEHATMKKVDGAWKLAERRPDKDWPGRAGCAVAGAE